MAAMGRSLIRSWAVIERTAGGRMHLRLQGWPDESRLLMEGGQGFVPTHAMQQVQDRLQAAVWRGGQRYFDLIGAKADARQALRVTCDKLHNAAFAGAADSRDVLNAIEAARAAGVWKEGPIRGWDASCDARIFACEYPGMPVITSGPGLLRYAHSDHEQINIRDVAKASEFLAHFVLRQTGTL
jgi:hypothetical protein